MRIFTFMRPLYILNPPLDGTRFQSHFPFVIIFPNDQATNEKLRYNYIRSIVIS
ncbi:hypothetical protein D1AOALGA4SA_8977 [Olavius algarvensis Delta 1 endosymbiont]|nr:hypothetical protein D1AOALGA4SA_8977 [Olavius algarvensis Delta 1 endosymbiont]